MKVSRTQKWLLTWSAAVLTSALVLKQVQLGEPAAAVVGAVEVVLAIATGIAFGLTVSMEK